MRVVFCGSGAFAVPSLRAVLAGPHEVVALVTQPARPAGRGGRLRATPVAEAARTAGLEARELASINSAEALDWLAGLSPDILCVVDFSQIVRRRIRRCARLDTVNVHASLLPKLRGPAPINWAIIRGHERTGVTTISLADEVDTGPVFLQAATNIQPTETAIDLRGRLAELGAGLLARTLDALADGTARPQPQDHAKATPARRLEKSDGRIDWSADAVVVRNLIRGTWPWPGGQATFCGKGRRPVDVAIAAASAEPGDAGAVPGGVGEDLSVATGSGRLRIAQIRPAGKRLMAWQDFVNGHHVAPGDAFGPAGGVQP